MGATQGNKTIFWYSKMQRRSTLSLSKMGIKTDTLTPMIASKIKPGSILHRWLSNYNVLGISDLSILKEIAQKNLCKIATISMVSQISGRKPTSTQKIQ